jgi:hypothetical protein
MRTTITPAEMAAHIAKICKRAKITITTKKSGGARAWRRPARISIRRVLSDITYAVALHEIGHILGEQKGKRLDQEIDAWEWAERHAIVWTPAMQVKRDRCLASYWFAHSVRGRYGAKFEQTIEALRDAARRDAQS